MIDEFINYLKECKNLSDKTLYAYCVDIKQFIKIFPNYLNVDMYMYVDYLTNTLKLEVNSIRRKIISVSKFYDYLILKGIISASPFDGIDLKIKQELKQPKFLTIDEIKQLLACFEIDGSTLSDFQKSQYIRDAALIDLLISTGIKVEEAANLILDDINIKDKTIFIRGKNYRQRCIYITSFITWNRIVELMNYQKSLGTNFLFTNRYNKQISVQAIEQIYTKYVKKTQINIKSTPNDLRHTFASNLLLNGADILDVQQILGHSSVKSTSKYVVKENSKGFNQTMYEFNYRNNL